MIIRTVLYTHVVILCGYRVTFRSVENRQNYRINMTKSMQIFFD